MHFKEWLIQIGKSPKTADNYSRAVLGAISNWANDAGLCTDSLDNIHSIAELVKIVGVRRVRGQSNNHLGKTQYGLDGTHFGS